MIISTKNLSILDQKILYPNLDISEGDFVYISGSNGTGKTTLLKILRGFYHKYSGSYLIDDDYLIDYYFSDFYLIDDLGVFENLRLKNLDISRNIIIELLDNFNIGGYESRLTRDLSMGEKQLVCYMRTILSNPDILFFDELTTNLDSINRDMILSDILRLNRDKKTILYVSHNSYDLDFFTKKIDTTNFKWINLDKNV